MKDIHFRVYELIHLYFISGYYLAVISKELVVYVANGDGFFIGLN